MSESLIKITFYSMALLGILTAHAQPDSSPVTEVESLVQRWIAIEQQRDALRNGWMLQKPQLELRLELLDQEREQLNTILDDRSNNTDEVELEREALLTRQNDFENEQQNLEDFLGRTVATLRNLTVRLPPHLAAPWRQTLDESALATKSNSEALQIVLELLTQLDNSQQTITLHEGLLTRSDGSAILVKQIFIGFSYAWYVSDNGQYSGFGYASNTGWRWQDDGSVSSNNLQRVVAILEGRQNAELLSLPLNLQVFPDPAVRP